MYNQDMSIKTPIAPLDERPDFDRILEVLRNESLLFQERTLAIAGVVNKIMTINIKDPSAGIASAIEPVCLVDYLWVEINRIRTSNEILGQTYLHLSKVIGD